MKNKILFLILIFILAFSMIACGGESEEDSDKVLAEKTQVTNTSSDETALEKEQASKAESDENKTKATTDKENKDTTTSSVVEKQKTDKYQTTQVPAGKPKPAEPQKTEINEKKQYECTVTITCKTILDNKDKLDPGKLEVLPKDGVILTSKKIKFNEGENVFDVLLRATKDNKIHMEFVSTPMFNSSYIEGINNIYEYDCGELSGWMYKVNDWFPNYGCSRYVLKNGDIVEWIYSCDLGRDIGGDWNAQNKEK